jgi:hypothetical protein
MQHRLLGQKPQGQLTGQVSLQDLLKSLWHTKGMDKIEQRMP